MHQIQIPLGDWSGDGHNICDWFTVEYDKEGADFKQAILNAREIHPDLDPTKFYDEYEDGTRPEHVTEKYEELGLETHGDDAIESYMEFIVWYLNQGDPELNARIVPGPHRWHPYGPEGIHFGYGLFS